MDTYKLGHRIEELILFSIILLNIFVFFEVLPGDIEYIKNIVSWSTLGYLLYKASLTKIFFGERHRFLDFSLLVAYFLLIVKNVTSVAHVVAEEVHYFRGFYEIILSHGQIIEYYTFIAGGSLLILLSLWLALTQYIKEPSLLAILEESGPPTRNLLIFKRMPVILLVLLSFFIIVFNLMMEWLAIAVDAPLLMTGLILYLILVLRHKTIFSTESFIFKLGSFGEQFYEQFIEVFHEKKKILFGISGMLVLHLLTDIGTFLLPFLFSFKENHLYFSNLPGNHEALIHIFSEQINSLPALEIIGTAGIFLLNFIGMLILLIAPAAIWYLLYKEQHLRLPHWCLFLVNASFLSLLFTPVFSISAINDFTTLVGVNITTHPPIDHLGLGFFISLLISLVLSLVILLVCLFEHIKLWWEYFLVIIVELFFGFYIFLYFKDIAKYYLFVVPRLLESGQFFVGIFFFCFFMLTLIFYFAGALIFLQETYKTLRRHLLD